MEAAVFDSKIVSIYDRLAHTSTTGFDLIQTVEALRRVLKGRMPSDMLQAYNQSCVTKRQKHRSTKELSNMRALIDELEAEVQRLETVNMVLEQERGQLQIEVEFLKDRYEEDVVTPATENADRAPDAVYSYIEVMAIVQLRFGKQNGFAKLWEEFSVAWATDPRQTVTAGKVQCWRKANAFPAWAVAQLRTMPIIPRVAHRWSPDDIDFLVNLYNDNPSLSDARLAAACSERFGCHINDNSIKSKFHILRKEGRISSDRRHGNIL